MDQPAAWAKIGESSDARPQRETRSIVVRKLIRVGAAATAAAFFVVALGGVAAAKTVSDKKYVKTLCSSINTIVDDYNTTADEFNAAIDDANSNPTLDAATFHTTVTGQIDGFLATVQTAQKKMKKLSPESGGKSATKLFDAYFKEQLAKLTEAADKFRAADPNGVAYQADVSILQTSLQIFDVGLSDPFSEIDDQDLIGAFDDEKSCDEVVTVIGG
jgi:outer membrane murein-binding lipoprotein Lpp